MPHVEKVEGAGFCLGVRRAIEMVERALEEGKVYTLGPVVHNPRVVEELERKGVRVVRDVGEAKDGTLIIPSHGAGPRVYEEKRVKIIDATCPFVMRTKRMAKKLADQGFFVIIFGDSEHTEVKGIIEWIEGKGKAMERTPKEKLPRRIGILSQTTKPLKEFYAFVDEILSSSLGELLEVRIINTICRATRERQEKSLKLAQKSDLMIVIGGKNSANTKNLANLCREIGVETYHIERASEIEPSWIKDKEFIGITAGTSTPEEEVEEVYMKIKNIGEGV